MKDTRVPFINLSIRHLEDSMHQAMMTHYDELSEYIHEAIKKVVSPEYLQAYIDKQMDIFVKKAIEDSVEGFFKYGEGRKVVAEAVKQKMMAILAEDD